MAQFVINIPNDQVTRVLDALTARFRYEETVQDQDGNTIPNPESKTQFAKRMIKQRLRHWVIDWEGRVAKSDAQENAVDPGIDIT